MGIEYLGLSSIKGPLVILEGVQDAFFDEIVEFTVDGKTKKIGRIIDHLPVLVPLFSVGISP